MEEYEHVPVPRKYVMKVYGYLARLEEGEEDGGAPAGATKPDGPVDGPGDDEQWSYGLIKRMYYESPDSMKAILGYLADRPGEWVRSGELIEELFPGKNSSQLGGIFGAFGRRVANRYGMDDWPFRVEWTADEWGEWSTSYMMEGWVAEKIRGYRDAAS